MPLDFDRIRQGTTLTITSPPWKNLAQCEEIITNTNALTADATVRPTATAPTQTANTDGLISTSGARFMVRPTGSVYTLFKFAIGHSSSPADQWGQVVIRGWRGHEPQTGRDNPRNAGLDRAKQYQRDFLCRLKLQAGATSAHPSGGYSLMVRNLPASNNQSLATELNWCDVIEAALDKTSGGVLVLYDPADGSAVVAVNNGGYSELEVEMSCSVPSDETGTAASSMTGCYTEAS